MARTQLQLPVVQNWSCHSCSGCCREHLIEITAEEKARIEQQDWASSGEIPADQPVVVRTGLLPGNRGYRLAHQPDGACVFLDEQGLCRIHARFGEQAKPLACLIYPYTFHPSGKRITVSLRYSCPSVVSNRGTAVEKQHVELRRLARQVVPEGAQRIPAPAIRPKQQLDWPDFLKFIAALESDLATSEPLPERLLRILAWLRLVEQSDFRTVRGTQLDEYLELIRAAASAETDATAQKPLAASGLARTHLRMLAGQYARRDTMAVAKRSLSRRWQLFQAAWSLARGSGQAPHLADALQPVPYSALETPFGFPEDVDELLTRFLRVKVDGLHFCGRGYYDIPLLEGFHSLVGEICSVLWLARWHAAARGRDRLSLEDVEIALALADHHHGFSPALARPTFRFRIRWLAQTRQLERLLMHYSR